MSDPPTGQLPGSSPPVIAVILEIVQPRKPNKHAYAVCQPEDESEKITFTITKPVWHQQKRPELGEVVRLSKIVRTARGLRAMKATY